MNKFDVVETLAEKIDSGHIFFPDRYFDMMYAFIPFICAIQDGWISCDESFFCLTENGKTLAFNPRYLKIRRGKWGLWEYSASQHALRYSATCSFVVPLEECRNATEILRWILRVFSMFNDATIVNNLIEALNDLLGLELALVHEKVEELQIDPIETIKKRSNPK